MKKEKSAENRDIFDDMDCRPPRDTVDEERLARLTPKHMRKLPRLREAAE